MLMTLIFLAANGALAQAVPAKPAGEDDKIVCKSERPVGSNLSQRVCKTRAKWTEDRDKARKGVTDINAGAGFLKPYGDHMNKQASPGG